jgi:peroxiredoxin
VSVPLLIARLLLGAFFGVAGAAKLADRAGSRRALVAFGVPGPLATPFGVLLPLAELSVALALIPVSTAIYGAASALALLLVFVAAIGINLARGRRPDCHCFGQLHSEPVGWKAVARNGLLAAVAAFIVVSGWNDPEASVIAWLVPLTTWQRAGVVGGTLGLAGLGAQTAVLFALVRQNRAILRRLAASPSTPRVEVSTASTSLPSSSLVAPTTPTAPLRVPGRRVGSPAPAFALLDVEGASVTVETLRGLGKPIVLFFTDPGCGACHSFLPEIAQWQRDYAGGLTLVLVSRGTAKENAKAIEEHGIGRVLLQKDREVVEAYGVLGMPSAVLIRADGAIGSQLAQGEAEIRQLMASVAGMPSSPRAEPLGEAPQFELSDLDGRAVPLAEFAGQPTILLFWNPDCPHCQRMLEDLKAWEALPPTERPQLFVVSTGTVETNRAMGLRSTIVLDPDFTVGPRFGVQGTPSAVLIDRDGRLAASPAVGAFAIFALAGHVVVADAVAADPAGVHVDAGAPLAPLPELPADVNPVRQGCAQEEPLPDGGVILYNSCRQQALTLNATGAFVWECCDGDHDREAIIAEVRDVFPTAAGVERDVRELLDKLFQAGLIAPIPALTTTVAETAAAAT